MSKREFYKKLMEQYTFDNEKIRENALLIAGNISGEKDEAEICRNEGAAKRVRVSERFSLVFAGTQKLHKWMPAMAAAAFVLLIGGYFAVTRGDDLRVMIDSRGAFGGGAAQTTEAATTILEPAETTNEIAQAAQNTLSADNDTVARETQANPAQETSFTAVSPAVSNLSETDETETLAAEADVTQPAQSDLHTLPTQGATSANFLNNDTLIVTTLTGVDLYMLSADLPISQASAAETNAETNAVTDASANVSAAETPVAIPASEIAFTHLDGVTLSNASATIFNGGAIITGTDESGKRAKLAFAASNGDNITEIDIAKTLDGRELGDVLYDSASGTIVAEAHSLTQAPIFITISNLFETPAVTAATLSVKSGSVSLLGLTGDVIDFAYTAKDTESDANALYVTGVSRTGSAVSLPVTTLDAAARIDVAPDFTSFAVTDTAKNTTSVYAISNIAHASNPIVSVSLKFINDGKHLSDGAGGYYLFDGVDTVTSASYDAGFAKDDRSTSFSVASVSADAVAVTND